MSDPDYPHTRRDAIVDEMFGKAIADPYRWLEQDIRKSGEVRDWVAAQNALTEGALSLLPDRRVFRETLTGLFDYEQIGVPTTRGNRHFHIRNPGLDPQFSLYLREDGEDRVLLDPKEWAEDGTAALAGWSVSKDGRHVAFAMQIGGTDWRTIRVLDVETGALTDDQVEWARFTTIDWAADGSGFFYNRYPEPAEEDEASAVVANQSVWFHRLGTPQFEDRTVFETPERPELVHPFTLTDDGRYLAIHSTVGIGSNGLTVIDLSNRDWSPRRVIEGMEHQWYVFGNRGSVLYALTTEGAERGRIVALDLARPDPTPQEIVPEADMAVSEAWLLGDRLVLSYLVDARTEIRLFSPDGRAEGELDLPGIGTALAFRGSATDPVVHFGFTSYDIPPTIYRHDLATGARSTFAAPEVPIDLDRISVEQRFYPSADGTEVPIFLLRRKDASGPAPTILYA